MPERRQFPSDPSALRDIRRFVHEVVTGGPFGAADADEVTLAVSEASADAMAKAEGGRIEIRLDVNEDVIVAEVADAEGHDEDPPDGARLPMGRGLPVIRKMMDEVSIQPRTKGRSATTVRMVRRRKRRPVVRD
jgi:anti-sigma regulatory factor (Ser/Thr protein kinase)